jgi:hypothetical protein
MGTNEHDEAYIRSLENQAARYLERNQELESLFKLRYDADMRAIKMWQDAHPGREDTWPDHADLVVWLMEQTPGDVSPRKNPQGE